MNKMKIGIYTRVSTDGQAEVEFNSCEAQEAKIKAFISSQDNMEIYKTYSDQGYSGADTNRPALMDLLTDIRQGSINSVIAYKIDRLTRSPKDFYQLIEVFEQHDVSFISVTERFDTSTPSGRLLRNIMLTFAQFERELISERIRDKMLERAKKGLWNSGITPLGYGRENKKLIINANETKIVKTIYDTYSKTGSMAAVYHKLKDQGIRGRNGKIFPNVTLSTILRNRLYTGKITHRGQTYQGIHEPIISEELFSKVQLLHKEKVKKAKVYNYSLFTGLVNCKECGSKMTFVFTNKSRKQPGPKLRYYYYRCTSISKRDFSVCSTRQVSMDRLDDFVIENLSRIAADPNYVDSLIFRNNHPVNGPRSGIEMKGSTSPMSPEIVKETLNKVIEAAKIKDLSERKNIIRKYVNGINYSKENIEVVMNYYDKDSENMEVVSRRGEHSAGGVWVAANAARRAISRKEKTAGLENTAVRSYKLCGAGAGSNR